MVSSQTFYEAPDHQTIRRKKDILNRDDLAGVGCELDFIPEESILPPNAFGGAVTTLGFVSLIGTVLSVGVGNFILPYLPMSVIASVSIVIAGAVAFRLTTPLKTILARACRNVLLVTWTYAALFMMSHLHRSFVVLLWMLLIVVPIVAWFAKQLTRFGIHWITAHPRGDGTAMFQGRDIWLQVMTDGMLSVQKPSCGYNDCTVSPPQALQDSEQNCRNWLTMLKTVQKYRIGTLCVIVEIFQGAGIAWLVCNDTGHPSFNIILMLATVFSIASFAWIRCGKIPARLIERILLRWFFYNMNNQATPWMFQSPCGKTASRMAKTIVTVGIVAIGVNYMAGFYWSVSFSLSQWLVESAAMQLLLAMITSVFLSATMPLLVFVLMLCVIAGPTLQAFDRLYGGHE